MIKKIINNEFLYLPKHSTFAFCLSELNFKKYSPLGLPWWPSG